MKEYISYIVKVGNGYLTRNTNASIVFGPKYEITLNPTNAKWFSKDDVFVVAKRYGGQPIGLLPVLLDVENDND